MLVCCYALRDEKMCQINSPVHLKPFESSQSPLRTPGAKMTTLL